MCSQQVAEPIHIRDIRLDARTEPGPSHGTDYREEGVASHPPTDERSKIAVPYDVNKYVDWNAERLVSCALQRRAGHVRNGAFERREPRRERVIIIPHNWNQWIIWERNCGVTCGGPESTGGRRQRGGDDIAHSSRSEFAGDHVEELCPYRSTNIARCRPFCMPTHTTHVATCQFGWAGSGW